MHGMISFDIDGVLANFTRGFTRIARNLYGTPVGDIPAQHHWMFEDFPELGLDKEMCDWNGPIWNTIRTSSSFWRDLDPTNVSIMPRINAIKNRIFITNRHGVDAQAQSVEFLERWGVKDPLVVVAEKKGPVAREFNVVAHVDDYMTNMVELLNEGLTPLYLAFHSLPYNRIHHEKFGALPSKAGVERAITLSVDQFIHESEARGLVKYV